jgi:hypothetical protein
MRLGEVGIGFYRLFERSDSIRVLIVAVKLLPLFE